MSYTAIFLSLPFFLCISFHTPNFSNHDPSLASPMSCNFLLCTIFSCLWIPKSICFVHLLSRSAGPSAGWVLVWTAENVQQSNSGCCSLHRCKLPHVSQSLVTYCLTNVKLWSSVWIISIYSLKIPGITCIGCIISLQGFIQLTNSCVAV